MTLNRYLVSALPVLFCLGALGPTSLVAQVPTTFLPLQPTLIEAPDGGPTSGGDINNAGVVIGGYSGGQFAWSTEGGFVHLEGSGDFWIARAINECNQVVGESGSHAVLWNTFDEVEDLGTQAAGTSGAWDINDRGEVVGYVHLSAGSRANPFIWTEEEGMHELFDCGMFGGIARGINNRREIVGRCNDPSDGHDHAFYWSERTGKIDIDVPGFPFTDAWSINDRGEVVGIAQTTTPSWIVRGFKWTRHGGAVLLRDLGDNFSFARFNNRAGWAIGEAVDASGTRNSVLWLTPRFGFQIHPGVGEGSEVGGGLNDRGDLLDTINFGPAGSRAVLWRPPHRVAHLLRKPGASRCLRPKH